MLTAYIPMARAGGTKTIGLALPCMIRARALSAGCCQRSASMHGIRAVRRSAHSVRATSMRVTDRQDQDPRDDHARDSFEQFHAVTLQTESLTQGLQEQKKGPLSGPQSSKRAFACHRRLMGVFRRACGTRRCVCRFQSCHPGSRTGGQALQTLWQSWRASSLCRMYRP